MEVVRAKLSASTNRSTERYMPGVMLGCRKMMDKVGLTYGLISCYNKNYGGKQMKKYNVVILGATGARSRVLNLSRKETFRFP